MVYYFTNLYIKIFHLFRVSLDHFQTEIPEWVKSRRSQLNNLIALAVTPGRATTAHTYQMNVGTLNTFALPSMLPVPRDSPSRIASRRKGVRNRFFTFLA